MPNVSPGLVMLRILGSVEKIIRHDGGAAGTYDRGHAPNSVLCGPCNKLSSRRTPTIDRSMCFWKSVALHSTPRMTSSCEGRPATRREP